MGKGQDTAAARPRAGLSLHGWAGVLLVALARPLNRGLPGLRTHPLFFPLWLGYALVADALVLRRSGTSVLARSPRDFALLFACSAPAWWLFKAFNERTHNWEYQLGAGLAMPALSMTLPGYFYSLDSSAAKSPEPAFSRSKAA